ncbi:pyridoxamine 5'-phosphate oxidase family protein [Desulfovibrio sp. OttesenSCG-928-I05]|nr:pyridoxamine 5'-phosphate oxidase family protein [Desulfovibrio sp. OttesenSCG-928-I05]
MRRTERKMTDRNDVLQVLRDAQELYIALNTGGAPYVVPVNFVLAGEDIYFHCATEGRKLELLHSDPRIGFTAAVDIWVDKTTTRYRSVCGEGRAEFVTDDAERMKILKAFAARFKAPCHFPVSPEKMAITAIIRIRMESLTGKYSHPDEGQRPMPHYER